MSVIRTFHDKEHPFTMLANEVLHDVTLSNGARGLWAQCMRRPDDWTFHISEIVKHGKDKKTAIYNQINELIEAGYVIRLQTRSPNKNGKMLFKSVEYIFFENKVTAEKKEAIMAELKLSFPHSGFPLPETPLPENVPLPIKTVTKREDTKKEDVVVVPAGKAEDFSFKADLSEHDLKTTNTRGQEVMTSQSAIYAHFIHIPDIPTEIIKEAINLTRSNSTNINNVCKYLESICRNLMCQKEKRIPKPIRKSLKKTEIVDIAYTPPKEDIPKQKTITLLEAYNRRKAAQCLNLTTLEETTDKPT